MPADGEKFEALPVQPRLEFIGSRIEQFLHQENIGVGYGLKAAVSDYGPTKEGIDRSHNEFTGMGHEMANVAVLEQLSRAPCGHLHRLTPYSYTDTLTPHGFRSRLEPYGYIDQGRAMQVTTVHHVQALVRGHRKHLGLSQETLARSAGTSRKWLSEFERGATTAVELPLVLRVLAALDLAVDISADQPGTGRSAKSAHNDELDLDEVLREYANRAHR